MFLKTLTQSMAVGPQIDLSHLMKLKDDGYETVINNRPDEEVMLTGGPSGADIEREAVKLGLRVIHLPIPGSGFGPEHVEAMRSALKDAGKTFAYCRSGTRSCNVWALAMAGDMPADDIIQAGAAAGYDLSPLRGYLDQS